MQKHCKLQMLCQQKELFLTASGNADRLSCVSLPYNLRKENPRYCHLRCSRSRKMPHNGKCLFCPLLPLHQRKKGPGHLGLLFLKPGERIPSPGLRQMAKKMEWFFKGPQRDCQGHCLWTKGAGVFVFFLGQRIILFTFLYRSISFDVDHFFLKPLLNLLQYCFCFMFCFVFKLRGMWDLSFLSRDLTCSLCTGK